MRCAAAPSGKIALRVLTTCSAVKSADPNPALLARNLGFGRIGAVSAQWSDRLAGAEVDLPAADLYAGRGFGHARAAAGGHPWIASAGLGLLAPSVAVPSYGATVAAGPEDDVFRRIDGARDPAAWWRGLRSSPFASPVPDLFDGAGPVLAALSAPYLAMLADDLAELPPADLDRLRIFTATAPHAVDPRLREFVMPCDRGRQEEVGAYRGVVADYAQRALRHFAETILPFAPDASFEEHADMMAGRSAPAPSGFAPR
jgi:hypothetical protein